ncbi:MAG: cytochrome c3 family protein [Desulfuromonadales bacterium]|nr:cytochrome c3 family protein [Desulfuromonadales bacterium]
MKQLLVLTAATIMISFCATTAIVVAAEPTAPSPPTEVQYTPKIGKVTFNHSSHQQVTECSTCHHTGNYAQCKSCHGIDEKAPKSKVAYHNQCKDCHKEMKQGPTGCKECHVK